MISEAPATVQKEDVFHCRHEIDPEVQPVQVCAPSLGSWARKNRIEKHRMVPS
jgi:hypothetical protein